MNLSMNLFVRACFERVSDVRRKWSLAHLPRPNQRDNRNQPNKKRCKKRCKKPWSKYSKWSKWLVGWHFGVVLADCRVSETLSSQRRTVTESDRVCQAWREFRAQLIARESQEAELLWSQIESAESAERFKMHQDMSRYVKICQDMSRYVKICQDMSRYVKICQDMSRYVKICQDMLRYVKICQDMSRWQKPSYTPALCLQASTKTITNHYTSASIGLGLWSNHYCESPQHTRHTTVSFYITAVTAPEDFRSGHSDLRLAPVGTVFLCALYSFLVFVSRRRIGRTAAVCSAWRRRTKHCCAPKARTKHSWALTDSDIRSFARIQCSAYSALQYIAVLRTVLLQTLQVLSCVLQHTLDCCLTAWSSARICGTQLMLHWGLWQKTGFSLSATQRVKLSEVQWSFDALNVRLSEVSDVQSTLWGVHEWCLGPRRAGGSRGAAVPQSFASAADVADAEGGEQNTSEWSIETYRNYRSLKQKSQEV